MIIKTLHVVCDHEGCTRWHEGDKGESRALPLVRQIRALGWVASDGRQYCPQHVADADRDHHIAWGGCYGPCSVCDGGARPCCHTTGPNHHPACQESK